MTAAVLTLPSLAIRGMGTADRGDIAGLRHRAWHHNYASRLPESLVQRHDYAHFFNQYTVTDGIGWLLQAGERIVGCYTLQANCIDELIVDNDVRRSGHGTLLLEHALQQLRARGFSYAQIGLEDFNKPGIGFVRQTGWRKIGSEPLELPGGMTVGAQTWSRPVDGRSAQSEA